jgi:hypothetical protein
VYCGASTRDPHGHSILEVSAVRKSRLGIAAVLLVVGLLWIAQGTGMIAGGAMGGQSMWALIGGVLVALGLIIVARELIRRPVS